MASGSSDRRDDGELRSVDATRAVGCARVGIEGRSAICGLRLMKIIYAPILRLDIGGVDGSMRASAFQCKASNLDGCDGSGNRTAPELYTSSSRSDADKQNVPLRPKLSRAEVPHICKIRILSADRCLSFWRSLSSRVVAVYVDQRRSSEALRISSGFSSIKAQGGVEFVEWQSLTSSLF